MRPSFSFAVWPTAKRVGTKTGAAASAAVAAALLRSVRRLGLSISVMIPPFASPRAQGPRQGVRAQVSPDPLSRCATGASQPSSAGSLAMKPGGATAVALRRMGDPMRQARAVRCMAFGEPEDLVLQEIELPAPGPGEVRVRLRAAGLNFADGLVIAGKYQLKPALPFTPGLEGAGEIVEVGQGVDDLRIGQRVAVLVRPGGGYPTQIVAKAEAVTPLPDGTDDVAAACLPVTYGTAHLALGYRGGPRPGGA